MTGESAEIFDEDFAKQIETAALRNRLPVTTWMKRVLANALSIPWVDPYRGKSDLQRLMAYLRESVERDDADVQERVEELCTLSDALEKKIVALLNEIQARRSGRDARPPQRKKVSAEVVTLRPDQHRKKEAE